MAESKPRRKQPIVINYSECPQCGTCSKEKRCPKCGTENTKHSGIRLE